MDVNISYHELANLVQRAADEATKRTIEELGLKKEIITMAEIKRLYGKDIARQCDSFKSGIQFYIRGKKGLGTARYCKRADFEKFLFETQRYNRI